jgi:N-acetylneuraminic acid mutarotase
MYNYLKIRVSGQTNPYNGQPRTYRLRYTFFILFSFISSFSLLAQGNSWITKTDMPTSRYSHMTAVVNGKIYAIGGVTTGSGCSTPAIQTVEEYNPLTNTWNTTKTDMPTARESFALSAVNGKIYSLGGSTITCTNQLKTVEEYDPDTDTWATTKTGMPTARAALSTSVVNGKIYAIGGYDHDLDEYLANVEEYDPITDEWVTKTPMPDARAWFSTCVVAGKIYAFGGYYDNPEDSTIYVYDPGTDTWDSTAAPFATGSCITDTLNGMIYIFGGRHLAEDRALADVWRYNPNNDIWDLMSPIPVALAGGPSSVVNGKIYIIGGSTTLWPSQPSSTVFEFTPPWTTKLNMPTPRHSLGTGVVNGKIYAIGGVTSSNGCDSPASSKVEAYDPDTDTWDTTKTPMPMERESFAISVVNDKIFVMGGSPVSCENHTSTVQEYNPQTDTWDTNKSSMPTPRTGLSTSVVNGKIYAIGGYTYDPYLPVSKVEEYDPNTDKWTEKEPMLTARGWFTTCVLDNKIFAFGGWNGEALGTVDVYDPVTNVWMVILLIL